MSNSALGRTSIRVPFLFDGNGTMLRDALVVIQGDRIAECGLAGDVVADIELRNSAIVPPLVNAHTHLEFSDLVRPISADGSFADWISAVIATRFNRHPQTSTKDQAIRDGLRESRDSGCLRLGEIATNVPKSVRPGTSLVPQKEPDQRAGHLQLNDSEVGTDAVGGVRFLELLAASPDRAAAQLDIAKRFLESHDPSSLPRFRAGLSPHAPYSTSMQLVEGAVDLARSYDVPVAMHLAESQDEMQLLATQDGPLADFLRQRKIWPPPHLAGPTSPMQYLQLLAKAPRSLIIHGNYLSSAERQFVANHPTMSIVYCPRTHAHFHHSRYPLAETLAVGCRVALGTDSRASNPDLNIWAEAQFVAKHHGDVPAADVLPMVTSNAAIALGESPQWVKVGMPASFTVIGGLVSSAIGELPPDSDLENLAWGQLLAAGTFPAGVWVNGVELSTK